MLKREGQGMNRKLARRS